MSGRRNPAIAAGLLGLGACLAPATAHALSVRDLADVVLARPETAFVAGAAAGAVLGSSVVGAAALVRSRRRRRREEADLAPDAAAPSPSDGAGEKGGTPAYRPRHLAPAPSKEGASEPEPASGARPAPKGHGPGHAARDYEDIAENYVGRASFRERMALRAQGVAATLRERMGASMMDGVPVIERADGSVGDVGTSWWQTAVGADAIASGMGFAADEADLAIPSDFSATDSERLAASASRRAAAAESIARRVAFVDEGVYPERRTVDDLAANDEWASALRALDEQISAEAPAAPRPEPAAFLDSVGDVDTLDEPDNLEPATAFIPFKTPAGHPEVVDTETYVDYLIGEELGKNSSSPAVRRSSRRFLRVLEGGTQDVAASSRHLAGTASGRPVYAAKHFSVPQAAEA